MFYGVVVSGVWKPADYARKLKTHCNFDNATNQYLASYKILTGKNETICNHKCGVT